MFGEQIKKDDETVEAEEILNHFKEFLLIFYGAYWSPRAIQVANSINNFLIEVNPDDDHGSPLCEVIYVSNDIEKREFKEFYKSMMEESSWCTLKWGDPNLNKIKNEFSFESLPCVIVLDRNLRVVTREAADDLINMDPLVCRAYWISLL